MWLLETGGSGKVRAGPQGILKHGNKTSFVTCVLSCTSAGLGDVSIIWHLEMG